MAKNAHFFVVAYDIPDDKRRLKVMNTLLDYGGTRVNYSVFECLLPMYQLKKLKKDIEKIILKQKDNVRYYPLCEACIKTIDVQGVEVPSSLENNGNIFV